jgi:hypothetical protein
MQIQFETKIFPIVLCLFLSGIFTTPALAREVGTYNSEEQIKSANASWTGYCLVEAVEHVGQYVYLHFDSSYGNCSFSSIRAKGDAGRTWAILGASAMTNNSVGSFGSKIFVQRIGKKVLRVRLCYSTYHGGVCSRM